MKKKERWMLWGALAGVAAWFLWWRKEVAFTGIAVSVTVPPEVFEGSGPYGAWTQITNNGQEVKAVNAVASGDVGGIPLVFSPASIPFTLDPGQTLTDYFWFHIPAGTIGLTGQVTVNVNGVSGTASFIVVEMP